MDDDIDFFLSFNSSRFPQLNETFRNKLNQLVDAMMQQEGDRQNMEETAQMHAYDRYARGSFPVILSICALGLVFNVINIIVLTRKRMSSSTAMLLTGLAVADVAAVLVELSNTLDKYLHLDQPEHFVTLGRILLVTLYFCLFNAVSTISNWMTVVIGTWRYIAVTWPLRAREWCTRERARTAIVLTYLLSVLLCLPIFLCFKFERNELNGTVIYVVSSSDLANQNNMLLTKIVWGVLIFTRSVPCAILTAITACLIRSLCVARINRRTLVQQRPSIDSTRSSPPSDRTTGMLLVVLVLFLLSNLPYAVCSLLHTFLGERFFYDVYLIFYDILQLCVLVNHSINFVVYCFLSQNFRKTFFQVVPVVKAFRRSFKTSTCATDV